jgi:hypothetical protein
MEEHAAQSAPIGPGGPVVSRGAGARKKKTKLMFVIAILNVVIMGGVFYFVMGSGGCSSVEGQFVATGKPLGNFKFVAEQCRSGQRMNFFGVVLLGKGPNDGAIVPIQDVAQGKMVKVEIPGSCQPPDLEVCKEVNIKPDQCSVFQMSVKRTNTRVNNITLLDGYLKLDCKFEEGGTVKADFKFESCD